MLCPSLVREVLVDVLQKFFTRMLEGEQRTKAESYAAAEAEDASHLYNEALKRPKYWW
jgi:hypothetical protein